jgi:hypothetical protein
MPPAPVETPVDETWVGGGAGNAEVCGSGRDSTRPVGAAGPREIEPVTSEEAEAPREAKGLESKRVTSELQPANPTAISVRRETRKPRREQGNSTR